MPWRELLRVYRRLEARGDIRGGRFVSGIAWRAVRVTRGRGGGARGAAHEAGRRTVTISAADPLNLCGILTAGDRVPAVASTIDYFHGIGVPLPSAEPRRS